MLRTSCVVLAGTFSAMALFACADTVRPTTSAVTTIDTVAGVELVHNAGAPPSWTLIEILTLGSAGGTEAAADDEFGRVSTVIADDSGYVYVADANATEIRVFDAGGTLVRRIGRRGSGPAEYQELQSIGWLGDTLAVLDPGNARLGLFLKSGEWLDHRPYLPLYGDGIRLHSTGLGELYMPFFMPSASRSGLVYLQQTRSGPGDTITSDVALPGSAAVDELRERQRSLYVICRHSGGRGISSYSATLAPQSIVMPAPAQSRAVAWSSQYRISFLKGAGDTVRVVDRDLAVRAITDEDWLMEEQKYLEFLDTFTDETCEPRSLPRPDQRRIILSISFDDSGRMWVERETTSGRAFDAFDGAGRLLGTVASPDRLDRVPPFIRGDRMYLVVTDSLEVEYVKGYAIRAGAR